MFIGFLLTIFSASALAETVELAITIDDLPASSSAMAVPGATASTKRILEILKEEKVPGVVAFVTTGDAKPSEFVEAWLQSGFTFGNHTFSHPDLDKISAKEFSNNVRANEAFLKKISPESDWHYFRYPFLRHGTSKEKHLLVRRELEKNGYRIVPVTVPLGDSTWYERFRTCEKNGKPTTRVRSEFISFAVEAFSQARKSARTLFQRETAQIMVFHPNPLSAGSLSEILQLLKGAGGKFVSLEQAMKDPVLSRDPGASRELFYFSGLAKKLGVKLPHMAKSSAVTLEELDQFCGVN